MTSARRRDVVPTLESAGQKQDTLVRGAEEYHAMEGHSSCRPRVTTNEFPFFLFFFKFLLFYYLKKTVVFVIILFMAMHILLTSSRGQKETCTPFCLVFYILEFL